MSASSIIKHLVLKHWFNCGRTESQVCSKERRHRHHRHNHRMQSNTMGLKILLFGLWMNFIAISNGK